MCVCYPLTQDVVTFGFLTDGARRQTASACRLHTVVDTVMNWQIGGGGGSSSSSSRVVVVVVVAAAVEVAIVVVVVVAVTRVIVR